MRQRLCILLLFCVFCLPAWAASCPFPAGMYCDRALIFTFIGLGAILLEFALPTKGVLGVIGAILFIVGTTQLTRTPYAAIHLSWSSVVMLNTLVLGTLGIVALITVQGYTRKNAKVTDPHQGQVATVIEWTTHAKRVELAGAIWQAASSFNFMPGDKVVVTGHDNLTVQILPSGETI